MATSWIMRDTIKNRGTGKAFCLFIHPVWWFTWDHPWANLESPDLKSPLCQFQEGGLVWEKPIMMKAEKLRFRFFTPPQLVWASTPPPSAWAFQCNYQDKDNFSVRLFAFWWELSQCARKCLRKYLRIVGILKNVLLLYIGNILSATEWYT